MNGCIENDDSSKKEQKLNNCPNGCLPLLSNSSINNMHVSEYTYKVFNMLPNAFSIPV